MACETKAIPIFCMHLLKKKLPSSATKFQMIKALLTPIEMITTFLNYFHMNTFQPFIFQLRYVQFHVVPLYKIKMHHNRLPSNVGIKVELTWRNKLSFKTEMTLYLYFNRAIVYN